MPPRSLAYPIGRSWTELLSRQLLQHRGEANAALAGKRGGFGHCSLIGVGAGKADTDLIAAEHRPLALARGVLVIDELAFPFAVTAGAGADIIEKGIAATNPAVVQHHDAGVAAVDAVKHPYVNGIKAVSYAAFSRRPCRRRSRFADRRHHRVEGNAL